MHFRMVVIVLSLIAIVAACAPRSAQPSVDAVPISGDVTDGWAQIEAAARREGQVVVMGQTGTPTYEALASAFEKRYPDISVDYSGVTGAQMVAKITTERAAGLFGVDVTVHGTTSVINGLLGAEALDPILPALIGPDNRDGSKWRGGAYEFSDEGGKYALVFLGGVKVPLIYNPNLVSPTELVSYWDLLDPKWKGKIAMLDPRVAGSGLASTVFFYTTPELGRDFIEKLFIQQGVVFTKDDRQLTDWVARGQYPIAVAASDFSAIDMKSRGLPVESLPGDSLKEGTYVTASWGSVVLLNRAPHPNAARVYLNWLLSKEGQEAVADASGYPSRRQDTARDTLREAVIPRPNVEYRDLSRQRFIEQQEEVATFLRSLIPN